MKKVIISATLLIVMVAGAMVLSSFTMSSKVIEYSQITVTVPTYWEGYAGEDIGTPGKSIYIKVYQSDGMCNSYYAVVVKDDSQIVVRENPKDNRDKHGIARVDGHGGYQYFVSYRNSYYYFNLI